MDTSTHDNESFYSRPKRCRILYDSAMFCTHDIQKLVDSLNTKYLIIYTTLVFLSMCN